MKLAKVQEYRARYYTQLGISIVVLGTVFFYFLARMLFAAPTLETYTITTQASFDEGTYSDAVSKSDSGGEIELDATSGWFNSSWGKRKAVTIDNSAGGAETNYQVEVDITYDSDMASDFDDIRFANAAGTELDFWLEEKVDSSSAKVWVEVDSLAAADDTIIYMYYDNGAAASASNGENTFLFFDDFDDASIDAKWTEVDNTDNNITEFSGKLDFNESSIESVNKGVRSDSGWSYTDGVAFEYEYIWDLNRSTWDRFLGGWTNGFTTSASLSNSEYMFYNRGQSTLTSSPMYKNVNGANSAVSGYNDTFNTDVTHRVRLNTSGGAYFDRSSDGGDTWTTLDSTATAIAGTLYPGFLHGEGGHEIDNARVRYWMTTEPSVSFGSEETEIPASGTWTSDSGDNAIDIVWNGGWTDNGNGNAFEATVTTPGTTTVDFEMRLSDDKLTWTGWYDMTDADADAGRWGVTASTLETQFPQATYENHRYIQVRATLSQSDGNNPEVSAIDINYLKDVDDPTSNPTTTQCWDSASKSTEFTDTEWAADSTIYCEWSGAADADSGIAGYYVYLGTNASADPAVDGSTQAGTSFTSPTLTTNSTYYLRFKAYDALNNVIDTATTGFTYKYDGTAPENPNGIIPNPAGFTNVDDYSFSWDAGTDTGGSGIDEYCYKTGEVGFVEVCTSDTSVSSITSYQDGANIFYVRSKDNVGNYAVEYLSTNYYFSEDAPSPPRAVTATPESSDTNSFTLSWIEPLTYSNPIARYHYSINALPTSENTTTTVSTSVGPGAFATQQGTNFFYVVAEDTAGNIEYDAYGSVSFTANTTAPGIPVDVTVTDSSIRAQSKYSATLTWDAPTDEGSGVDQYVIERSTDEGCEDGDGTFTERATTDSLGYLDSGLSNEITYCYRIKASDDAGATSEASSIVSILPEGRYTSPPNMVGSETVTTRIQSAVIEWLTDREGSSFVEFGTTEDTLDRIAGQDDFLTSHEVTLLDLEPATTYYYRVKYTDQDNNTGYSSTSTFTTEDAPSAPTSLSVDPSSNTANSFTFTWSAPVDEGVEIQGYFYSINEVPTADNTSFTAQTTLGPGAYATRQGANVFYVVAVDDNNNVNYNNYASVEFSATTSAPKIPKGLIITDSSNRDEEVYSITLIWNASTVTRSAVDESDNETITYLILRSADGGDTYTEIATTESTGYLDFGLDSTTEYYYKIQARDSAGATSAASSVVSETPEGRFTTPPAITTAPSASVGSFSATVTWETERDADSHVEYGLTDALGDEQGTIEETEEHTVQLAGLDPETKYYYRIRSRDEDGNVALSAIKSFTTLEAPQISNVEVTEIGLYDALVSWTTNLPLSTGLDYGLTSEYGSAKLDTSGNLFTTHSLELDGLSDSTEYHFRIQGNDAEENLVQSDDYTFETLTLPRVLSVSWENVEEGQTRVNWTTNVPTTSEVEYYNEDQAPRTQGNTVLQSNHSVLLFGLEDATAYDFVVRGRDQFGFEAESSVNTFRTLEDTTPPIIAGVQSESNTIGSGDAAKVQIVVSWKTDEPTTSKVEYGEGLSGGDFTGETEENAELVRDHVVVISGLEPSNTYHFRVVSRDKAGNTSVSNSYSVLTSRNRQSFTQLVISNLEEVFAWIPRVVGSFQ